MHNRGTVQGIGIKVNDVQARVGVTVPGKKNFPLLYENIVWIKIHIKPVVAHLAYIEKTEVFHFWEDMGAARGDRNMWDW